MNKAYLILVVPLLLSILLSVYVRIDTETSHPRAISYAGIMKAAALTVSTAQAAESSETAIIELDWDSLIPADWRPNKLLSEYNADNLSDDDPRAQELMDKLKAFYSESPVVHDYDGKLVKLPGFVVPLEMDTSSIQEFLLVPYYGACIHVPPPPANQTVHVVTKANQAYEGKLFDTVWVTGTITVERLSSELAESGYRIEATSVEPYE